MIKCPFCHFENEDGALFCERCTSDLTSVAASSPSAPPPPPPPRAAVPPPPPPAAPLDHLFSGGPVLQAEAIPFAAPPLVTAEPIEAIPLEISAPAPAPVALEQVFTPPAVPATPAPASAPAPVAATPAPAAEPSAGQGLPAGAQPRLLVLRGQKRNVEYPLYEGLNFIGRADEKPVDIDLEEQEPPDRIWCSRQHACISFEDNLLAIEDLNSANGTYVNRTRVYPGAKRPLAVNDVLQIGNVQMRVVV